MRAISKALLAAGLVFVLARGASAQTADEIIEKHLTAIGGRAALAKLKSRTMTGTIAVSLPVGGEASGSVEITNQAPNKSRQLIKIDLSSFGIGQIVQDQLFDGTTAYMIDSFQGNRDITGNQLDNMKNASFPSALLNYKESGVKVELAGKEKAGTRDAFVLVMTPKLGSVVRMYFDAESYLPVKTMVTVNVPQVGGDVEQTVEQLDYREVDGLKVPFQITGSSSLQTYTITFTNVAHNVEVDQSVFSKP